LVLVLVVVVLVLVLVPEPAKEPVPYRTLKRPVLPEPVAKRGHPAQPLQLKEPDLSQEPDLSTQPRAPVGQPLCRDRLGGWRQRSWVRRRRNRRLPTRQRTLRLGARAAPAGCAHDGS
jgi:hypothetical protein